MEKKEIEKIAKKFHEIYQKEAKRQGDVRHKDNYEDLSENIKEFDRVLARHFIFELTLQAREIFRDIQEMHNKHGSSVRGISITEVIWDRLKEKYNIEGGRHSSQS